jgi:hypothetical protein
VAESVKAFGDGVAIVVSFDSIVGVPGGVVKCCRHEVGNNSDQGVGPVSGDLIRLTVD